MALERFGAQVGDAMAFQVLCPGEGLAAAVLRAGKAAVIVVLPVTSMTGGSQEFARLELQHYTFLRQKLQTSKNTE